jgi:hypothetical protein
MTIHALGDRAAGCATRRAAVPRTMRKLSPTVQRLILAFTTGLFLACAARVSGQEQGFSISAPITP